MILIAILVGRPDRLRKTRYQQFALVFPLLTSPYSPSGNSPSRRTPLLIPRIGTQVRHHHDDRLPRSSSGTAAAAGSGSGRSQLEAGPAPAPTPGTGAAEYGRARGRRVHSRAYAGLPGESRVAGAGSASASAFKAIIVSLQR